MEQAAGPQHLSGQEFAGDLETGSLVAELELAEERGASSRHAAVLDPSTWRVTVESTDESGKVFSRVIDLAGEVDELLRTDAPRLTLSPDGRILVLDYPASGVSFWNTGTPPSRLLSLPRDTIRGFDFSPDGKLLALDRVNGEIELRETATLKVIGALAGDGDTRVRVLRFLPDGELLLEAGVGGGLTLWDLSVDSWRRRACAIAGRELDPDERSRFGPSGESSGFAPLDWLTRAGRVRVDPCASGEVSTPLAPESAAGA